MIDRLLSLYRLKVEPRTGWLERGVADPESVADHSWGTALLCLLYAEAAGVDTPRAVSLALVHDIAEAVTGDRPARFDADGALLSDPEKSAGERRAIERLFPAKTREPHALRELWQEYEERESLEAAFVRDMNLIDMCIQALIYETGPSGAAAGPKDPPATRRLAEFFETTERRLTTPVGRELFGQLRERYRSVTAVEGGSGGDSEP